MENSKLSTNIQAIKSGSSYMLSNILISATSLITAPIFTRLLSTADYGIASNFAAWLNIGLVVIGLGLPYSIGNAKVDFPNELNKYLIDNNLLDNFEFNMNLISFEKIPQKYIDIYNINNKIMLE